MATNFAKNYTGIYRVRYESGDFVGTSSFRYRWLGTPNPSESFVTAVGNIFYALRTAFFDNFAYLSARVIPANQSESYPWVVPGNGLAVRGDAQDIGNKSPEDSSFQVDFQGRNGTSRIPVYFGGLSGGQFIVNSGPTPWRCTSSEWTVVAGAVAALNAAGLSAPNNNHASFDPYANYQYNKALMQKARR